MKSAVPHCAAESSRIWSTRRRCAAPRPALPAPVGFRNSAIGPDLGIYTARLYSLMRPPRTGRRLICSWERSATGWSGRDGRSCRLRWGRRPSARHTRRFQCRWPAFGLFSRTCYEAIKGLVVSRRRWRLRQDAAAGTLSRFKWKWSGCWSQPPLEPCGSDERHGDGNDHHRYHFEGIGLNEDQRQDHG